MSMSGPDASAVPPLRQAWRLLVRLGRIVRPHWLPLAASFALGPLASVLGLVLPYLTKLLIDEVHPTGNVSLLHVIAGAMLAIHCSSALMEALNTLYSQYVTTRLNHSVSLLFFNHVQHLPMRFFEQRQVGEVLSRYHDVKGALGMLSGLFAGVVGSGIYLVLVPPFLFLLNWKLALVALIGVPLTLVVTGLVGERMRARGHAQAEAEAELNAFQVEAMGQVRTIKSFALERFVFARARTLAERAIAAGLRMSATERVLGLASALSHALTQVAFIWVGWLAILDGSMSLGDFMAFTAYAGYLYAPFSQLAFLFQSFQRTAVNLDRMFEYLDAQPEQPSALAQHPHEPVRQVLSGGIQLRGVLFGYHSGAPTLADVNLDIAPGTQLAIVGTSGAGKTTLLRLLARLEVHERGQISFDGVPIEDIGLADLRRQIAVVWQDAGLLRGSIWDNVTTGLTDVDVASVDEVMAVCQLDELVRSLPRKYQTPIAEWGASVSAGQRQRLSLARALLRQTPILLLDEATANIDVETEARLLGALFARARKRGQTVVFVTHRLAWARHADRICVVDAGQIAATGTHEQLLRESPPYQRLWVAAAGEGEAGGGEADAA